MAKDKRTSYIKIMCTPEEKEKINENAQGNVSSFIRALALKNKKIRIADSNRAVDPALIEQVRRIGVSLNQIARVVNTQKKYGNLIDVAALNNSNLAISNQLEELVRTIK